MQTFKLIKNVNYEYFKNVICIMYIITNMETEFNSS